VNINFSPTAWAQYLEWQKVDRAIVKKINDLITDIQRNGFMNGIGKPEPLTGWIDAYARERRTKVDWAEEIRWLLDEVYPNAKKIRLVSDNLNTHVISSLYEAFEAPKARALAKRLEMHHTPKHGSWLNIAEILISILARQCLCRRIPDLPLLNRELTAWATSKNALPCPIDWQFSTDNARIKLKYLYPKI